MSKTFPLSTNGRHQRPHLFPNTTCGISSQIIHHSYTKDFYNTGSIFLQDTCLAPRHLSFHCVCHRQSIASQLEPTDRIGLLNLNRMLSWDTSAILSASHICFMHQKPSKKQDAKTKFAPLQNTRSQAATIIELLVHHLDDGILPINLPLLQPLNPEMQDAIQHMLKGAIAPSELVLLTIIQVFVQHLDDGVLPVDLPLVLLAQDLDVPPQLVHLGLPHELAPLRVDLEAVDPTVLLLYLLDKRTAWPEF